MLPPAAPEASILPRIRTFAVSGIRRGVAAVRDQGELARLAASYRPTIADFRCASALSLVIDTAGGQQRREGVKIGRRLAVEGERTTRVAGGGAAIKRAGQ